MNKLIQYKQIIIFGGSTLLVTVAALIFFLLPYLAKISESTTSIHDKRVQLEILKRERENIEQTQRELSSIQKNIKELDKIFIGGEEVLDLISALEKIAEDNNITQELALLGEPTQSTIAIKLTLTCSWTDCLNYLSLLEQLDLYLSLTDPVITNAGDRLTMSFNAYAHVKQ